MDFYTLVEVVGYTAVTATILQFLSGALVCKQYVSNRTTGEATPLTFIACILSCGLWLLYGMTKTDDKIVLVNIIGVLLMTAYTIIFYMFTIKKSMVIKQVLFIAVMFFTVISFASAQENKESVLNFLGLVASIFTLVAISAPMSKLLYVIKVKTTECLPFPIILMTFLVSSLWTLYGYLIHDSFLKCVNIVGAGLAIAQLSLFFVYPNTPLLTVLPK